MRALVLWLRSMYERGLLGDVQVDALVSAGRIDSAEADYVRNGA
jgi:hypothetical protein